MGEPLDWNDRELRRITRIRLVSDPGFPFWDVSYAMGVDQQGRQRDVRLPVDQLPRSGPIRELVRLARIDGIYLTRLCGGRIENVVSKLW